MTLPVGDVVPGWTARPRARAVVLSGQHVRLEPLAVEHAPDLHAALCGPGDADLWTYGMGAEYEISNTPFSVAAGFNRGDIEDVTIDTWTIGLRYSFGGGLQARDRAGAALPGAGVAGLLGAL